MRAPFSAFSFRAFSVVTISMFCLLPIASSATNLGQFDTRSMALGGAGVAGASSANASAFNPALMATEANRKNFGIIPLSLRLEAFNENEFIETVEDAEALINDNGTGLNDLLDGLDLVKDSCGTDCYTDENLDTVGFRSGELASTLETLSNSNLLLGLTSGIALQFGKERPVAIMIDGGISTQVGLRFAATDTNELQLYSELLVDGQINLEDRQTLSDLGLINVDSNDDITFVRGNSTDDFASLVEVIGATYTEVGVSLADSFNYEGREFSVGITPKIVSVDTIKFHQSVESEDLDNDDILDDDNINSKTDFNLDLGLAFKPMEDKPLLVGVTIKNLFSRSYGLKQTQIETQLVNDALAGNTDAIANLNSFNFDQAVKIQPQLTIGVAYELPLINLLADLDLNAAEVLGRESQHLSLGAEFDVRYFKTQIGFKTAIGGANEDSALSAGLGLGPLGLAVVYTGDQVGAAAQLGFSF